MSPAWAGFFSILGAVVGAVSGSLIAPYINFRLSERSKQLDRESSERSRRSDLYKTIYPEKIKAAHQLMEKAASLYLNALLYCRDIHIPNHMKDLDELIWDGNEVSLTAQSLEWLLGSKVATAGCDFELATYAALEAAKVAGPDAAGGEAVMAQVQCAYFCLCDALRDHLHLSMLEELYTAAPLSQTLIAMPSRGSAPAVVIDRELSGAPITP